MSHEWLEKIKSSFGDKILKTRESVAAEWEVTVTPGPHKEVLAFMKSDQGGAFVHLADLTAYDEHPKSPRFFVTYVLISMKLKQRALVVVPLSSDENPKIESICDLWEGANWLERETYDMFGIEFTGHPDHRRLLLPVSFKGFPLRKDFILDYRQQFPEVSETSQVFDPFGNNIVSEGLGKDP